MRLLRDLWAASPRRTAALAALIVLGSAGQAVAAALAGPLLVHRSAGLWAAAKPCTAFS
jgi:ATP-binding cassette subfamily B protein